MVTKQQQPEAGQGQPSLLRQQRFLPFFCTQFFGAFNDNVYKNALILLIAYESLRYTALDSDLLNNLAAGLFILPFFLFSAFAGQLADKYEKSGYIRWIKNAEIMIMCLAALAFYMQSLWGLMGVLFLMGAQSAFFGPVKYSIIPQHLAEEELVSGNAFVEMGTFLAILLGTAGAGLLMLLDQSTRWISVLVFGLAIIGRLTSQWIPVAAAQDPGLQVEMNPFRLVKQTMQYAYGTRSVFLAILGISWFWFLGASYLTQLPNYTIEVLSSQKSVVTLLLCVFSVGIGAGSMLCARLSGHKVEIGIVPLGSLGLSVFGADLYFASDMPVVETLRTLGQFMQLPNASRVLVDMALIGVFGGLFIVPLYAMVQQRTAAEHRARVIAANNILNALLMVLAAVVGVLLLGVADLSKSQYFLVLALANAAVACYIYAQAPEFTMRFIIWLLGHSMYRVKHTQLQHIPDTGPAVLVCNHVSYVDALLLGGAIRRPVRFVMYKPIYDIPVLNFVFRTGRAIPIASASEDPEACDQAYESISQALQQGQLVCIFPEGQLTRNGELGEFKKGVEKVIARDPVPVVPLALRGLWGSFFSHADGRALVKWPRRAFARLDIVAGEPVAAETVSAELLQARVQELRGPVS